MFTDTAVAFVHSSLKHQLEDAGRGRGLPDGDMAAKQAGLPSSRQGGVKLPQAPHSCPLLSPGPVAGAETTPKALQSGYYHYLPH